MNAIGTTNVANEPTINTNAGSRRVCAGSWFGKLLHEYNAASNALVPIDASVAVEAT